MSRAPDNDPIRAVAQPVEHALSALIAGAAASFGLSIAIVLLAVFSPEGLLHEVAHVALIGIMAVVVAARGIHVLRGRGGAGSGAWRRARDVRRWDTHLAQALTITVPIAWLVGGVTILAQHLLALGGVLPLVGIWLPVAAGLWIAAAFAWHDFCHDRLAVALDESHRRYRGYWRDIARPS